MAGKGAEYMRAYREVIRRAGSPKGNSVLNSVAHSVARMSQAISDLEKGGWSVGRTTSTNFIVYTNEGIVNVRDDGSGGFILLNTDLNYSQLAHPRSYNELMRTLRRMGQYKSLR